MSLEWGNIKHITLLFVSPVNISTNLFLIYMVTKYSNKALHSYKKILYLGACYDIFLTTVTLFCATMWSVKNGYQFVIIQGLLGPVPEPFTAIFYSMYHYVLYLNVAVVSV
uniref:Serpentine receptor class gamma n=1 Tax=Panagrolaimus sp. JU765 TaxID=591449 RepID=A0AC34Q0N4_9BILA